MHLRQARKSDQVLNVLSYISFAVGLFYLLSIAYYKLNGIATSYNSWDVTQWFLIALFFKYHYAVDYGIKKIAYINQRERSRTLMQEKKSEH